MGEFSFNNNNYRNGKITFSRGIRRNSTIFSEELMTIFVTCIASIGIFSNGILVGWSANVLVPDEINKSPLRDIIPSYSYSWIASALALGAAWSALAVHKIWFIFGSKVCILGSCIMMINSWVMIYFSHAYWMVLLARFLGGFAVGILQTLIPIYVYDIATDDQHDTLEFILQTQFVAGIVGQFLLGLIDDFRLSCILSALAPIVCFICFVFLPESPRFLCFKRKENTAKDVIKRFKDIDNDVEVEMQYWSNKKLIKKFMGAAFKGYQFKYAYPVMGITLLENLSGPLPLFFYLQKVFHLTGSEYSPLIMTILCGAIFLISINLPNILDSIWNKKILLIGTLLLMAISLIVFGLYCHYKGTFGHINWIEYRYIPLLTFGLYIFFYSIGPYRLIRRILKMYTPKNNYFSVRCLATSISFFTIFIMTKILPRLIDIIGVGWVGWSLAFGCIIFSIFVGIHLPRHLGGDDIKLMENNSSEENSMINGGMSNGGGGNV